MIDPQVFELEIAILMDWFNRDFEPETLKRLHQRLSAQLTTQQFVQACQIVFDTSRFFPTVEEFVSAVIGDAQTSALHEWEVCLKAAARADREMLTGLSPQGQSALHLVGGLYKLGMASEEQLVWIKKEFVSVWKSTRAEVKSLPASYNCEPIKLDAVRELSQKMSFKGNGR
jgi:hypothetical protein